MNFRRLVTCVLFATVVGTFVYGKVFRTPSASANMSGMTSVNVSNSPEEDSATQVGTAGAASDEPANSPEDSSGNPVDPSTTPLANKGSDSDLSASEPAARETPDEKMSRLMVGKWEMDRDGLRKLTVNDDGTASMDVALEGSYALMLGSKIQFDIKWLIKDSKLIFETTGGKPETSVSLVTKLYGAKRTQPILELTEKRMLLKDADEGEPDHDWKRAD